MKRIVTIFLLCTVSLPLARAQEPVDQWLRRMGCRNLLALYLEQQLLVGTLQDRSLAIESLSELYVSMLSASDEQSRKNILRKAKELIERVPDLATTDLRLQLLRGSYLAAEQLIEQYRFRVIGFESYINAIAQMREINNELATIQPALIKKLGMARGKTSQLKARNAGLATTLLAWSTYYLARHDNNINAANKAALLFAKVLEAEHASLQEVSTDLRIHEYGARALLGIALCKEVSRDPAGPEPWLEELAKDDTWPSLQRQLPLWRLHILIDRKNWDEALVFLDKHQEQGRVPDYWLLLLAARALEEQTPRANNAALVAVEGLTSLGRLGMISGLVEKHGTRVLAGTNFVAKYIEADLKYQNIRELWDGSEPSTNASIRSEFEAVALLLEQALGTPDASRFDHASSSCRFLLGHAYYQAREFDNAAISFLEAADGEHLEEALWMIIVSLDRIEKQTPTQIELRRNAIERYLLLFPNSNRSSKLRLHRSFDAVISEETIEDLLAIPSSDPAYDEGRRRAEDLLYKEWREAKESELAQRGTSYLAIATSLMHEDAIDTTSSDQDIVRSRVRRVLEVSLHDAVNRPLSAKQAFSIIESLSQSPDSSVKDELNFRRVQLLLLEEDIKPAIDLTMQLLEEQKDSKWTIQRVILVLNLIRSFSDDIRATFSEIEFRLGVAYLSFISDADMKKGGPLSVANDTASLGLSFWQDEQNEEAGLLALGLANRIIAIYEHSRVALRTTALLEESLGDLAIAKKHWRTLGDGLERGTLAWFEARFHLIFLVSEDDATTAISLLDQHQALYPDYADPPWGKRFRNLQRLLKNKQKSDSLQ
ncbi:MAG: hypothetical protein QF444_00370 [Phycisphaerales bacterium]|nr:hypothetical protein [Phycisphaerales bacterium]